MEFTANQIAALAGGTVDGNGDVKLTTVAKIEEGHPGALSFLANPKYIQYIYTTGSSAVLVSNDFKPEKEVKATMIRVADPYATIAHLLKIAQQMMTPVYEGIEQPSFVANDVEIPEGIYIGAFAYIADGVTLGKNVKIFPQAYIGKGVAIGDNTIIYSGVKIYHGCKIGKNCIIHSGAVIGADGFGFAPTENGYDKIPQIGNVEIADDVEIGANTTIDRAMMGSTHINKGVKLDNLIQIAHNCVVGENTVMASQVGIAGSAKVGKNCMFGGQVGIAGHITIGDNVQIAAQSGVKDSAPDNVRLFGAPAVDFKAACRQAMYVKDLPELYRKVKGLERDLKKQQEN